jgi:hypothetical protein
MTLNMTPSRMILLFLDCDKEDSLRAQLRSTLGGRIMNIEPRPRFFLDIEFGQTSPWSFLIREALNNEISTSI